MAKKPKPELQLIAEIEDKIRELVSLSDGLSNPASKKLQENIDRLINLLEAVGADLDPIKLPTITFDPSKPEITGRLVALALLPQPRLPLDAITKFYGSGVYAIYYDGGYPAYRRLAGTETPIYIGKADPGRSDATTPREQGPRLSGRLEDHRRMIVTVQEYAEENDLSDPLSISDFSYRRLVAASNTQFAAEKNLINLFKPIWNNEMKICWGISKHGDSAGTRGNKRSPWDVIHPGRKWALDERLEPAKLPAQIFEEIENHLDEHPPITDRQTIIEGFLETFIQHPIEAQTTNRSQQQSDEKGDLFGDPGE